MDSVDTMIGIFHTVTGNAVNNMIGIGSGILEISLGSASGKLIGGDGESPNVSWRGRPRSLVILNRGRNRGGCG